MVRYLVALCCLLFVFGCAEKKTWYLDYGIAESDLGTDKAIIAAAQAIGSREIDDIEAAGEYLNRTKISEHQAELLMKHSERYWGHARRFPFILKPLVRSGHYKVTYPLIKEGLKSSDDSMRVLSAQTLGSMGCDAKDSLPMLELVSESDSSAVQEPARIAIREISLDCRSKNASGAPGVAPGIWPR